MNTGVIPPSPETTITHFASTVVTTTITIYRIKPCSPVSWPWVARSFFILDIVLSKTCAGSVLLPWARDAKSIPWERMPMAYDWQHRYNVVWLEGRFLLQLWKREQPEASEESRPEREISGLNTSRLDPAMSSKPRAERQREGLTIERWTNHRERD